MRRLDRAVISPVLALACVAIGSMVAGCGGSASHSSTATHRQAGNTQSTPAATGKPGDLSSVRVIRGWANALRRGNVAGAASYFAVPSTFADGSNAPTRIHSSRQALIVNASLPCGAQLISTHRFGPYVNALFKLTGRPGPGGTSCGSGTGQTARTNFLIRAGRIVAWIRAPDEPGDNKGAAPQASPEPAPPPAPGSGSGGGPTV
ncbi:MAG: hypothetical protein WAK93_06150 [Solirubrobacteraceae bacterium]